MLSIILIFAALALISVIIAFFTVCIQVINDYPICDKIQIICLIFAGVNLVLLVIGSLINYFNYVC